MKRIFAVCLLLFIASTAEGNGGNRGWSDWVSEGKAFIRTGNYSAAAHAFRQALAVAEGANADEQKLAAILDALASADAEAGQYAESEHEYRRVLALAEKMEGRQSLAYGLLTASLAVLPTQIGNRAPVIETLREAITVNQRTGSTRELAIIRSCLAHLLMDARRLIEAESVLLETQSDAASLRTTDPGLLGDLRNGLGVLRFDQGRYSESVDLYLEALRLLEGVTGDEHPSLVAPLNNLALSYLKLGRFNDAELTLRRGNAICRKTLGEDHATCGALLEGYAVVLRKLNRKPEARAAKARSNQIARAARNRNGIGATISVTALQ